MSILRNAAVMILCSAGLAVGQDPAKETLRQKLKDNDVAAEWIYDDLAAGFAQAKKTGKPMLVVFR